MSPRRIRPSEVTQARRFVQTPAEPAMSDSERRARGDLALGAGWRREVLDLVLERDGITIPEISTELSLPHNRLYVLLPVLAERELVVKRGRKWFRP